MDERDALEAEGVESAAAAAMTAARRAAAALLLLPFPKPEVAVMMLASDADGTMNRRNFTVWPRMMVQYTCQLSARSHDFRDGDILH